jgi:glutaredoxin-related protein
MSESYVKILEKVSVLLDGYPTEQKLFGSAQKFVFVLEAPNEFQKRDFLVGAKKSDITPYRMLVPSKLNDENVTFVFYEFPTLPKMNAEELADAIFLTKVILKEPLNAKVLCGDITSSCPYEFQCDNCMGILNCRKDLNLPCFKNSDQTDGLKETVASAERKAFLESQFQKLKFETIDPRSFKWKVLAHHGTAIKRIFNDFHRDVAEFARKVCDHIAPNHSYMGTDIIKQNETYVRFQATNLLRFIKKRDVNSGMESLVDLYIPENLVEILKNLNLSNSEEINENLETIMEKYRQIDQLNFFRDREALHLRFKVYLDNWKRDEYMVEDLIHNPAQLPAFSAIYKDVLDFQHYLYYNSDVFKKKLMDKFEDIYTNFIRSLVDIHANNFAQSLNKLYTWVDANVQELQQDTKISVFFRNLKKKVDKYFSNSNAMMIESWFIFHRQRVPQNWQAQLFGFGRSDAYWLLPEYDISELKNKLLKENITLFEFTNILDYCLRESVEDFVNNSDPNSIEIIENLIHSENFKVFFSRWKYTFGVQPALPLSLIKLLEAKYKQSFGNVSLETFAPIFQNSVKRALIFTQEKLKYANQGVQIKLEYIKEEAILIQLKHHAKHLFKGFMKNSMDRVIQNIIQLENSRLDSVLSRLSHILIDELKRQNLEIGLWRVSQPYERMVTLKYSLTSYEDFLQETKIIFYSNHLEIPIEVLEYLELIQSKFEHLQIQVDLPPFEKRINTSWNWGRNFFNTEKRVKNSGKALVSSINFGVRSVKSASFNSLEGSVIIFLFYGGFLVKSCRFLFILLVIFAILTDFQNYIVC